MADDQDMPESGDAGATATAPEMEQPEQDLSDKNVVTLPPDVTPPGSKPKKGDKLTFCVTEDMGDNGTTGYFEMPEGGDMSDWDSMAREELSPRKDDSEGAD
jgi:hypothetical protein